MGTAEGKRLSYVNQNGGIEWLRIGTIQWAMVDMLRNPPKGFEDVTTPCIRPSPRLHNALNQAAPRSPLRLCESTLL